MGSTILEDPVSKTGLQILFLEVPEFLTISKLLCFYSKEHYTKIKVAKNLQSLFFGLRMFF